MSDYGPTPAVATPQPLYARYIHGGHTVDFTPLAASDYGAGVGEGVPFGAVLVLGDLIAIATAPIAAAVQGALVIEGTFEFPKPTGIMAQGLKAYWDNTNHQATLEPVGNKYLGKVETAAASDDTTVRVQVESIANGDSPEYTDGPLLSGATDHGIHTASATQAYALGTIRRMRDGRIFRYAKSDTGGVASEFCACNPLGAIVSAVVPAQGTDCGDAGDTKVTVTVAAGGGAAADGAVAANELLGGYLWLANGTSQHPECFRILANTVVAAGGGTMDVTVDQPLAAAVVASTTYSEVFCNPYAHVKDMNVVNSAYVSALGVPGVTAVANRYFWLQTRGPCWITSDGNTGKAASGRVLRIQTNGSVKGESSTTYVHMQAAGYAMDLSASGTSNSPLCFLQFE